jgi:hypothetical protein
LIVQVVITASPAAATACLLTEMMGIAHYVVIIAQVRHVIHKAAERHASQMAIVLRTAAVAASAHTRTATTTVTPPVHHAHAQ